MIGIVGGVGPYAGLDLAKNVFDNTIAQQDQDHLDLIMLSVSRTITDRTEYLMGRDATNPAAALANVILRMESVGATVAGIPCNTAHAKEIFSQINQQLEQEGSELLLLSMVDEAVKHIQMNYPGIKKVGILSTTGTYKFGIYSEPLKAVGIEPVVPDFETQDKIVHASIYNREYGIKAKSNPVTTRARKNLLAVGQELIDRGAELIIKGCTEIVLAVPEDEMGQQPTIDPSIILARALIHHFQPKKLKPVQ